MPDPRSDRKKPHDHAEILTYIIMGILAGRTSLRRALKWARKHINELRKHMDIENGIASVSTVSRLLKEIDEEMFLFVFMEWISELLDTHEKHIIIDGKALRGAAEKSRGGTAPYILNVVEAASQMVILHLPIGEKGNEAAQIPRLLDLLDIKDAIVTIDAIGSTQAIMKKILEKEGHFLLTVKENLPVTYEQIGILFKELKEAEKGRMEKPESQTGYEDFLERYSHYQAPTEKNRGRIEYREMSACSNVSTIDYAQKQVPEIKTIGYSEQVRTKIRYDRDGNDITPSKKEILMSSDDTDKEKTTGEIQIVGLISDLEIDAKKMAEIKRKHWTIENSTHHVLDETLREDRSTATKSRNNLALIRKFVYNIMRIAIICEYPKNSMQEMMDDFADDFGLMEKYIFFGIESFY